MGPDFPPAALPGFSCPWGHGVSDRRCWKLALLLDVSDFATCTLVDSGTPEGACPKPRLDNTIPPPYPKFSALLIASVHTACCQGGAAPLSESPLSSFLVLGILCSSHSEASSFWAFPHAFFPLYRVPATFPPPGKLLHQCSSPSTFPGISSDMSVLRLWLVFAISLFPWPLDASWLGKRTMLSPLNELEGSSWMKMCLILPLIFQSRV